jgi:protoporphyrinogen oxidase
MKDSTPALTIVGGGITGLVAAYLAARNGLSVRVLEGSESFGGLLGTFPIGGTRLEHYYHHFFTHDAEINWLLRDLGLEDRLFFKRTTMGVLRNGCIFNFNGLSDLLRFSPLSVPNKFRFILSSAYLGKIANWRNNEDISALEWFRRFAGRQTTSVLWEPLLRIKFGPYVDEVPLSWMIGRLRQRMNSRKGAGEERLGYLKGSLHELLQALLATLRQMNVELHLSQKVEGISVQAGGVQGIRTQDQTWPVKQVLATLPTLYLVPLVAAAGESGLARALERIRYFGAVCVVLELDRPLTPVYWLNVADPGSPFGGVIEQTNFLSPELYGGHHIAYLSRYFAPEEEIASWSGEEIARRMIEALPKVNPAFRESWLRDVHYFRTRTAATVCDRFFSKKVPCCRTPIDGFYIASMPHVYPDERSVNNSIRVAAEACRVMGLAVDFVPANASLSGQIGMARHA